MEVVIEMDIIITGIVFSIVSFGLHRLFRKISLDNPFADSPEADGVITKITDSDTGKLRFYVSFMSNEGKAREGYSAYYAKTYGKYQKGDNVRVKYRIVSESKVRIELVDSEIVTNRSSLTTASKVTLVVGFLFMLMAVAGILVEVLLH